MYIAFKYCNMYNYDCNVSNYVFVNIIWTCIEIIVNYQPVAYFDLFKVKIKLIKCKTAYLLLSDIRSMVYGQWTMEVLSVSYYRI